MKKLFLIPALLLLYTSAAFAQVKVGIKAGATRYSEVYRNTLYGDLKDSGYYIYAGVFTTIPLTEQVYVRPELVFSPEDLYYGLTTMEPGFTTDLRFPVLIGYNPVKNVSVLAGPEFRYSPGRFTGFGAKRFEAGFSGGINYRFWKNFSLDTTYTHGLTNLRANEEIELRDATLVAYKGGRSRNIRLGLAYTFGKYIP